MCLTRILRAYSLLLPMNRGARRKKPSADDNGENRNEKAEVSPWLGREARQGGHCALREPNGRRGACGDRGSAQGGEHYADGHSHGTCPQGSGASCPQAECMKPNTPHAEKEPFMGPWPAD